MGASTPIFIYVLIVAVLVLFGVLLVFFARLLYKLYRSVKIIDSPANIVESVRNLRKVLTDIGNGISRVEAQTVSTVSSQLDQNFNSTLKILNSASTVSQEHANRLISGQQSIENSTAEIDATLKAVRDFVGVQQEELQRYKDGYDYKILKTCCLGIIRALDSIGRYAEELEGEQAQEALQAVRDELEILLDSQSIESWSPELGVHCSSDTRKIRAVHAIENSDPSKESRVAKVLRAGYIFLTADGEQRIIRPAEVSIYQQVS